MERYDDLISVCNKNVWLRSREYDLRDYGYCFKEVDGIDELKDVFEHGNWAIRQGFILNDLAFVQQVNGGDEWLALKKENGVWKSFESISFEAILKRNGADHFRSYMNRLIHSTTDQYWGGINSINSNEPDETTNEQIPEPQSPELKL